jgi:MYXO-CTERM domain-containing protein
LLDRRLPGPFAGLDEGLDTLALGAPLEVAAYGVPAPSSAPGLRRAGRVPITFVDAAEVVAGSEEVKLCSGDSGGGAFRPETELLAAIVSRGAHANTRCDRETILTRIDVHRAWLVDHMNALERSGQQGGCSISSSPTRTAPSALPIFALVAVLARQRRRSPHPSQKHISPGRSGLPSITR